MKVTLLDNTEPKCMLCKRPQEKMIRIELDVDWSKDITIENNVKHLCQWCFRQIDAVGAKLL